MGAEAGDIQEAVLPGAAPYILPAADAAMEAAEGVFNRSRKTVTWSVFERTGTV